MPKKEYLELFAKESDSIEGEAWDDDYGVSAIEYVLTLGLKEPKHFFGAHWIVAGNRHPEADWIGKWRTVPVTVGGKVMPKPELVPELMHNFLIDLPEMTSWEAYVRFERIHPFQDFNGRLGRILWLWKALDEDYMFELPFLQMFHYQTLNKAQLSYGKSLLHSSQ